jgi:hypothetical protein
MGANALSHQWWSISSAFNDVCRAYDQAWVKRRRCATSLAMTFLILRICYSKNSQGYGTMIHEMWESLQEAIPRLRFQKPMAASSFCEARAKIDEKIFKDLNAAVIELSSACEDASARWLGHRIFTIDASKITLPHELISWGFKPANEKTHYPQGLVSTLFNLKTKLPYDVALKEMMSERVPVAQHLDRLSAGDVVVYDRGYFSYELLWEHVRRGVQAVFRLKGKNNLRRIQAFLDGSRLLEDVVKIKPEDRYARTVKHRLDSDELRPIALRIVKYRIKDKVYYLATTLLDSAVCTIEGLKELYHARWGVEEFYKSIKRMTIIEDFHGRSLRTVLQEVYAHTFLITLSRLCANTVESEMPKPSEDTTGSRSEKKTAESAGLFKLTSNTAFMALASISSPC